MAFNLSRAMSGAGGAMKDAGIIGFRQTILEDRAARQREWQTGEREAGQKFQTGEREAGQRFRTGEREAGEAAAAKESKLGRESSERIASEGRASSEKIAQLGRDTQVRLAEASKNLQIRLAEIGESKDAQRHQEVMARMDKQFNLAKQQLAQGGVKVVNTKDGMAVTYSAIGDDGKITSKVVPITTEDGTQVQPGTVETLPAVANALASVSSTMSKFLESPTALTDPNTAKIMTKQMTALNDAAVALLGRMGTGTNKGGGEETPKPVIKDRFQGGGGGESDKPTPATPAPASPAKPGMVRGSMGSQAEFDAMLADAQRGGETGQSYLREKLKYNELSLGQRQAAEAALR